MVKVNKCQEEQETVLKTLRDTLGLTQQQLADSLGIHRMTIIRCENGKREIMLTLSQFQRFCKLIHDRLGVVALVSFVTGEPIDFGSQNLQDIKGVLFFSEKK